MDARNNIATDLFYKIRSRFSGLKLGAETGEITINPEEARFFDFDYMEGENPIGHVSISLAEPNSMKIYFSHGITENMDIGQKGNWYKFLRELRQFAKRRLLSFDTRDIAKDNLDKRDYAFLSQNAKPKQQDTSVIQKPVGESVMNESAMYGTKTMSYQKLMDTRLIIKHNQAVMDDTQPGARTRNISALFVENQDGERFKYPFIHLAGARAMQRHVANGGLPYDDLGKSIISMSEEIAQLKSFGNYVVRNDLMNSDNNSIVERSTSYLNQLRETIAKLSKQSHYEAYKESFQARGQLEVPDEVVEDFTEKFTVRNFKEDIKSVFPVLYRLMQEENSIGYDDIVAMTTEQETNEDIEIDETEDSLDPFDQFENWVMGLGEQSAIDSENAEEQAQAIKELQELVGQHFPAGVDGTNAIESLKGIIEDPALYQQIKSVAKEDPDTCVRPLIKQWLEQKAPEVLDQLDFGDMTEPEAEPAAEVPAEEPVAQPQEAADNDDEGASADDEDKFHGKLDKLVHKTFGHSPDEEKEKKEDQKINVQELAEFITSFYDRNTGTFPKGPEGVCTMVGKKFGEQAESVARKFVERMAPQQSTEKNPELAELARIRELSGIQTEAVGQFQKGEIVKYVGKNAQSIGNTVIYRYQSQQDPNKHWIDTKAGPWSASLDELKSLEGKTVPIPDGGLDAEQVIKILGSNSPAKFQKGEIVQYVGKNTGLGDRVIYNYQSNQDPNKHWVDTVLGPDSVSIDELKPLDGKTVSMQPGGNDAEYVKKVLGASGEKESQEQFTTEEKIDWNSPDVQEVKAMGEKFYVKDTPEGRLLLGEDIDGYWYGDPDGEGQQSYMTFVVNIDTGEFLEYPNDYEQDYGYLDDTTTSEFINDVIKEVKVKLGNKEESVSENEGSREAEIQAWYEKYSKYKGYNGDSLPEGWVISMLDSGVMSDGFEAGEVEKAEQALGTSEADWEGEQFDAAMKMMPITRGLTRDLAKIFGVDSVGEEEAEEVNKVLGFFESATPELEDIKRLSGISQGIGF